MKADLRREGFCKIPALLETSFVAQLKQAADALGELWTEKLGDHMRAQGSMTALPRMNDPIFGKLITHPTSLIALNNLGLGGATFTDGYVISKPPHSPRLFWHFDWFGWTDNSAYATESVQVFLMYYLTDTSHENGCLRVIPGSHLNRHRLHDLMHDGHANLHAAEDLTRPEFADWPEEVEVPVKAGDLIIGDARMLHASHANDSELRRSLVTLWYQPHYANLPGGVRATLAAKTQIPPASWPTSTQAAVIALQPPEEDHTTPLPRTFSGPKENAVKT
ncbi:MAG: phytanoyl-CoA dioxygenase family protein [Pseudomonadota bacterium]